MNSIQASELEFHDRWADSTSLNEVKVRAAFEGPAAMEVKHVLDSLGDLRGRRILEVGAGLGEASVYFALQGATVVASDLSPAMVRFQQRLAAHHGVTITSHAGPAETLELPGGFDVIYAANLLHHLTDKETFLRIVHRLLKPEGIFVSWDPLCYNPIINVYRRLASKVRTEDEAPLSRADFKLLRRTFPRSRVDFFWLSTQLLFLKYWVFDRLSPSRVRYWKRIYDETDASLWWWKPLRWLDQSILLRLPGIRWLAWNGVFIGRKGGS